MPPGNYNETLSLGHRRNCRGPLGKLLGARLHAGELKRCRALRRDLGLQLGNAKGPLVTVFSEVTGSLLHSLGLVKGYGLYGPPRSWNVELVAGRGDVTVTCARGERSRKDLDGKCR